MNLPVHVEQVYLEFVNNAPSDVVRKLSKPAHQRQLTQWFLAALLELNNRLTESPINEEALSSNVSGNNDEKKVQEQTSYSHNE